MAGGALKVYSDRKSLDQAIAVSERQRPLGLSYAVLDRKGCLDLVPALAPRADSLTGGIHYVDEEGGDCFKFCENLAAWCEARGAVFRFGTTILRLEAEGGRIAAALTDQGRLDGGRLRAGARRRQPAADAPARRAPADHPGQGLQHHRAQGAVPRRARDPGARRAAQVRHDAAAGAACGCPGLAEIAGYDTQPEARRFAAFVAGFTGLFPQLRCMPRGGRRDPAVLLPASGHAARPADPRPLARYANLHYNVGQGHLGWTLAHGSARIVAALLAGRDPGLDIAGLRPTAGQ